MLFDLRDKRVNVESIAKKALKDKKILTELLENLKSRKETIRYNSFKALLRISEKHPEVLYPKWNFFVDMIDSDNAYWKLSAVRLIANLTKADTKNKFEKIFNKYYNLLNDSVIVAGYITANSGKIARAKPKLQEKTSLPQITQISHLPAKALQAGIKIYFTRLRRANQRLKDIRLRRRVPY